MRTLLGLFLALTLCGPALASPPTIDASGFKHTDSHAVSAPTASVVTTSTNDAIVVVVQNQDPTTAATVSSITGCSLSFTRITGTSVTGSTNVARLNIEVWYAPSASAQPACTITVNLTASQDGISIGTVGVNGLNSISSPLDTNASAKVCTASANTPSAKPIVSTSQANDLWLAFGFNIDTTTPTTWTTSTYSAGYGYRYTATTTFNQDAWSKYNAFTSTQSSLATDFQATGAPPFPYVQCTVALTADAASVTTVPKLSLLGIG